MNEKLTTAEAAVVWEVLCDTCGVCRSPDTRLHFVFMQSTQFIQEWCFRGALGFGGKFWRNDGRWYVTCYREDETPERRAMIEEANKRLEDHRANFGR